MKSKESRRDEEIEPARKLRRDWVSYQGGQNKRWGSPRKKEGKGTKNQLT